MAKKTLVTKLIDQYVRDFSLSLVNSCTKQLHIRMTMELRYLLEITIQQHCLKMYCTWIVLGADVYLRRVKQVRYDKVSNRFSEKNSFKDVKFQRDKLKACFPIGILGHSLCPADSVKNLGVWFDSDFSLSKHVQNVCKSCFVKLRDFRHVRQFLTHDVSVLVANALVSSLLDYGNSLFRSLSKFNLRKLQCIQNSAARIVSNTSQYTSITPVLRKLHWLPVEQHTVFKTATLVYKYLHTGFPRYFATYLSSYSSSYNTRRSQSGGNFLVIPKFCPSVHKSVKQFGNSFAFDAPTVWNVLSDEIYASPSLASFRKQLKTYLYTKAYPP